MHTSAPVEASSSSSGHFARLGAKFRVGVCDRPPKFLISFLDDALADAALEESHSTKS
jgi:hypothetical protein